jgi:hypothetical protein
VSNTQRDVAGGAPSLLPWLYAWCFGYLGPSCNLNIMIRVLKKKKDVLPTQKQTNKQNNRLGTKQQACAKA